MNIKRKLLFLHVPKTAGTSLRYTELSSKADHIIHPINQYGAFNIIEEKKLEKHFKFAFTRNPWDRFVSLYFYFLNMKKDDPAYKYDYKAVDAIQEFKTLEDFCLNYWDFSAKLQKMSPEQAKSLAYHGKFHFRNQSRWTHHDGENITDYIGKFENLLEDVKELEDILGLCNSNVPHLNKTKHKHYKKYYNQKMINAVAEIYEEDIKNFNYEF